MQVVYLGSGHPGLPQGAGLDISGIARSSTGREGRQGR